LSELLTRCQVLQISGTKLFDETRELAESGMVGLDEAAKQRYRLVPYMKEEMPLALQAATLVICRAGAATLSELAVLGKPSILVPLPPALGSSPQEANAAMFDHKQATEVIFNSDLKPELLVSRVISIISSSTRLQNMVEAVSSLAKPDATQAIVETVVRLARGVVTKAGKHEVMSI
jgi:UDP-N-acetylglucosamine--N-acetylmuramyl-(pentapeptide) pyrophosphoryl-undecaprenol N-acetylglucosamine transferase